MARPKVTHPCVVENCEGRIVAWNLCDTHYRRWRKTGDVHSTKFLYWQRIDDEGFENYFWAKVAKTPGFGPHGECWEWQHTVDANGYGQINVNRRRYLAHRLAWQFTNGREPNPILFILHGCDNRKCVNPDHLREGTQQDNMDDMVQRGRSKAPRNQRKRIGETVVRQIRSLKGLSPTEVIAILNVSLKAGAIRKIQTGRSWKHII